MNVQEFIELLEDIENKELPVSVLLGVDPNLEVMAATEITGIIEEESCILLKPAILDSPDEVDFVGENDENILTPGDEGFFWPDKDWEN